MKYLFHLGHPAHFHLFKHTIIELKKEGHDVLIAIKKKDVLEELLLSEGLSYHNILPEGKKKGKFNLLTTQIKQIYRLYKLSKKEKIDLLCGTSASIGIVGKLLAIRNYNFNEDDAEVVPLYAKMAYPFATKIIAPDCCSVGKWEAKKIAYPSYHELAYLHPNHFQAKVEIAQKYVDTNRSFFLIRFAKLTAHHDTGINGISEVLADEIIHILLKKGNLYITSEVQLNSKFKQYELNISPKDIHHVMAFATMFIGDSQTMCAESGVLGIPFIRINDFVGKISYLKELEEKYKLGFSFKSSQSTAMIHQLNSCLAENDLQKIFQTRKKELLKEKIDLSNFIIVELLKQKP
jgi:uncharacterized protein